MVRTFLRWKRRRWNGEIPVAQLPAQADAANAFGDSDIRIVLAKAIASLPPRQRAVIVLRYFADLSEAQTAAVMGCSVGAVKSHGAKALAKLKDTVGLTAGGAVV
jgi:RNA polymerase sigma factor (sigma-70 family)